ncbi:PREDICTED: uncharacterized protein LOC106110476 [Papilio polytes]|uniref:uncharacterized protein LOC106110476 n=1 Tax=Papilio polytes TaxID=76194 RepID=UPI0006761E1C|nr:PREDICTED: uncharacterized protein LOC106110476 [Papilio polytes]
MKAIIYVFLSHCFLSTCLAELSEERKVQFVTRFVDYLNNLPNHAFIYDDGVLLSAQKTDENNYKIEVKLKVTSIHNLEAYTYRTCSVTLEDHGGTNIHIKDDYKCEEPSPSTTTEFNVDNIVYQEKTTTEAGEHVPVQLDNEVQSNTAATSGEQFIAIPREKPAAPCIGCSTFVNPGAAGVEELALLGIRHLNRHEPDVKHELNSVVEVERQVQIVNGVRYIITLKVDYNNCTIDVAETCTVVKPCKITILEKPWVRLYDGSKYRGILANNCTEEWIFSDNGEVIHDEKKGNDVVKVSKDDPDNEDGAHKTIPDFDKIANTGSVDDILKAIHNSDVQSQPVTERTLSEGEVKNLEEQIIPYNQFSDTSTLRDEEITAKPESENFNSHSINKIESRKKYLSNSNSFMFDREEEKINSLNNDKKKAIDDLINFFASVDSHSNQEGKRNKRNLYFVGGKLTKDNNDPMYKTLAEESLAKYLQISNIDEEYEVLNVENVQVQVVSGQLTTITFQIVKKGTQSLTPQKCVADVWEKPWIQFKDIKVDCQHSESQDIRHRRHLPGGALEQNPNDPKYLELAKESMEKYLETTGNSRPHKVVEVEKVTTQVVSGTMTEIHFKILPAQGTGDVISCLSNVWEQAWLKKKDIDVKCQVGDSRKRSKRQVIAPGLTERNPNDPEYLEPTGKYKSHHNNKKKFRSGTVTLEKLVLESLEKLEKSSAHKHKQRVNQIINYSSNKSSGPTTIYFDVGYTTCLKFELVNDITQCKFLNDTALRHCVAHVWERPWLKDGKDIEVSCEERTIEEINSETAMLLAATALKHIEAKYSHPRKQKIVKLISFGRQLIAGVHYRMKIEVGPTNCMVLSPEHNCTLVGDKGPNKICNVNVWPRPSVDRFLNIRVFCDHKTRSNFTLRNQEAHVLFDDFLETYKPAYISNETEKSRRFEIFRNNVRIIHALNIGDAGTATYGVTKFADLTHEEFKSKFLGLKPSLRDQNQIPMTKAVIPEVSLPDAFDWRQRGAVTPVKDQGSCGSCWAFSVTGNVEGQWQIKTGNLLSLSEQELVDCDKLDEGCNGGLMDNAYRAIEQMGGLELEDDYPYIGKAHDKCIYNKTLSRVTVSGAVNISNNETNMAKWLVKNGPISIGINANAMQFYMGGVSHPWRMLCSPDNLDHGVLIVGYGVSDYPLFHKRLPYWIVKNSWGGSWGERGYYRVYRGDGTCGVNMMASSAVV